jgi:nicotinamidase/pyrazinamidase
MRTVFVDVDTQLDFLLPAGALSVPGAEAIVPAVAALNRFAAAQGHTLLSTVDAHTENDIEFRTWPPHCIVGTHGQRKPEATLVLPVSLLSAEGKADTQRQILLDKQHVDCFTHPGLAPWLASLGPAQFVVYGVVTEVCVRHAVLGLARFGTLTIVEDAIHELNSAARDSFFAELTTLNAQRRSAAGIFADPRYSKNQ